MDFRYVGLGANIQCGACVSLSFSLFLFQGVLNIPKKTLKVIHSHFMDIDFDRSGSIDKAKLK